MKNGMFNFEYPKTAYETYVTPSRPLPERLGR